MNGRPKDIALDVLSDEAKPLLSENKASQYNSVHERKIAQVPSLTEVARLTKLLGELEKAERLLRRKLGPAYQPCDKGLGMAVVDLGCMSPLVILMAAAKRDTESFIALGAYFLIILLILLAWAIHRGCRVGVDYQLANSLTLEEQTTLQQTINNLELDIIVDRNDKAQINILLNALANKKSIINLSLKNIPKFNQAFFRSVQELRSEERMPLFPQLVDELVLSYVHGK